MQQNAYIEEGDMEVDMQEDHEGPLKDFFKDIEEARNNCEKIDSKINEVKKLQSEILNSPVVDKKMNQQMDDAMAEIKKLANKVRSHLKKMEQEAEAEEKARGQVTGELRIKKTQQMTASRRFVEVMTEYNRIQVQTSHLSSPSTPSGWVQRAEQGEDCKAAGDLGEDSHRRGAGADAGGD